LRFGAVFDVFDQQVGEFVGFVSGQSILKGVLAFTTMHPAIPLAVVVLVANPVVEATSFLRIGHKGASAPGAFLESRQMPFTDIGSVIPGILERSCDGRLPIR